MEDDREKLKLKLAQDEGEDVEGHKLEPTVSERETNDEADEDVERRKL